jgi:hypothetical protein
MTGKLKQVTGRGRPPGRPKCGDWRLETVLPRSVLDELVRREQQSGIYRTRIAAQILCDELIGGGVHSFTRPQ